MAKRNKPDYIDISTNEQVPEIDYIVANYTRKLTEVKKVKQDSKKKIKSPRTPYKDLQNKKITSIQYVKPASEIEECEKIKIKICQQNKSARKKSDHKLYSLGERLESSVGDLDEIQDFDDGEFDNIEEV